MKGGNIKKMLENHAKEIEMFDHATEAKAILARYILIKLDSTLSDIQKAAEASNHSWTLPRASAPSTANVPINGAEQEAQQRG